MITAFALIFAFFSLSSKHSKQFSKNFSSLEKNVKCEKNINIENLELNLSLFYDGIFFKGVSGQNTEINKEIECAIENAGKILLFLSRRSCKIKIRLRKRVLSTKEVKWNQARSSNKRLQGCYNGQMGRGPFSEGIHKTSYANS